MPDEQMIYLDPTDDLSRVAERLENATKQRVVLIVPPQTQLRSNVFWRLLHSRARGMGKDVTVVSADRQVRSVAKIAGFRIGDASGSSSSSKSVKSRTSTPVRTQGESRQVRQPRSPIARRAPARGEPLPHKLPITPTAPPDATKRQPLQQDRRDAESASARNSEALTGQEQVMDVPPPRIDEEDYDRPFEFRIGAAQAVPLNPLTPRKEEIEEQDPFIPDYEKSRDIIESWQSGLTSQTVQPVQPAQPIEPIQSVEPTQVQQPEHEPDSEPTIDFSLPPVPFEPASSLPSTTFPNRGSQPDPFDVYDDHLSAPSLPEQHGPAFVYDLDDGTPDIAGIADEVTAGHQIEDLGDLAEDEVPLPPQDTGQQWSDLLGDEPEEEEPPRRVYGSRPQRNRSGTLQRRPERDFYDDEDQLAPVEDRPTVSPIMSVPPAAPAPQPPPRQSGGLAAARTSTNGGAVARPQRPQRNVAFPSNAPATGAASRAAAPVPPGPARPVQRPVAQPRRQGRGRGILIAAIILLLILILGSAGLFYFGTSATVVLTVPAQTLSKSNLKLLASTNPQNKVPNVVTSQVLPFTASVTGPGTATGKTPQGSSKATGKVYLTNNGSQLVHIPSGTVFSTAAGAGSLGVTFVTTVDAVIPPSTNAPNNVVPLDIQAQNAGVSGNVGPNTITVIPADSLTTIAQVNNVPISTLHLSVTNPDATTGGGAANVPMATKNDIAALELSLHQKLQAQVRAWQQTLKNAGDQVGTPIPDVLSSPNPLPQEVLTGAPAVGQALNSSTIQGTLAIQIRALVVSHAALEAAAQHQLDLIAHTLKPYPFTVTTPVQITNIASIGSDNGSVLTITLNAVGQAVLAVNSAALSSYLAGKPVSQATSDLNLGVAGVPGVQNVKITVSPSILGYMPYRADHIHITVLPGSPPQPPEKPNG